MKPSERARLLLEEAHAPFPKESLLRQYRIRWELMEGRLTRAIEAAQREAFEAGVRAGQAWNEIQTTYDDWQRERDDE